MRFVRSGAAGGADEVVFETSDDVEVTVAESSAIAERLRRTRGAAGTGGAQTAGGDFLLAALTAGGMAIAADARLTPETARVVRGEGRSAKVRVTVNPGESAVVLLETEGGTFAWVQPDGPNSDRKTRRAETSTLTFTLGQPAAGRRTTRSLMDSLVDRLTKPLRTLVLKFAVRLTLDAVMARIEGDNPVGLVRVASADPNTWRPGGAGLPAAPTDRPMRILLLVHGTFSNTAGGFGHLSTHPAGRFFLDTVMREYDAVLGFDHKTLGESVEANAELMADALAAVPRGAEIDAIAHSRGALVLRVLAGELLAVSRPDLRLRRAIFVAGTNAGTHLASPENWETLADLYTNIVMAGARVVAFLAAAPLDPFVRLGIKTIGEFVQLLSQVAVADRRVPGLASMYPEGDTIRRLARLEPGAAATEYSAITSNYAPRFEPAGGVTRELAQLLLDRVTNDLWRGQNNDMVVDTASMTDFGARVAWLDDKRIYAFGNVETIYHTVYFTAPETCEVLLRWLALPPLPQALVARRRTRADRAVGKALGSEEGVLEAGPARRTSSRAKTSICPAPKAPPTPTQAAASMPETPRLGEPALLEVTLSREAIANPAKSVQAAASFVSDDDADLKVIVTAQLNCEIVGGSNASVSPPPAGSPAVLGFEVRGREPGPAEVWADIYQKNLRLARLVVQPVFVSSRATTASATFSASEADPPIVALRILEEGDEDSWRLRFLVSAPELGVEDQYFSEWQTINKTDYVASLYKRLENSWADSAGEFGSLMELVRADGADLFRSLFPEPMQRWIWDHKQRIGSLQVYAQEPSIPWEIVFVAEPARPLSPTDGMFLAEFGLTRWITNVGIAPATLRLRPGKSLYCIPDYVDANLRLPMQADEAAMLEKVLGAKPAEPRIGPILALLRRSDGQDYDHLHFACHGSADAQRIWDSGLLLKGFERDGRFAREELTLAAVRNNADLARDGVKPVIFLNACQSGIGGYGLSGAGGLAQAFVRGGAGLFVGTLWSVEDRTALTFSNTFYEALKNGRTVVQAAKAARDSAKAKNESTWLAYSVYGHPYARVSG